MDDPKTEAEPLPAQAAEGEPKAPDYYGQLLRLKAEFENYRKRVDRERPQLVKAGRLEMLERLLPIYDVVLAAHLQIQKHPSAESLASGMELIFKEVQKLFQSEGVAAMEGIVGKPYDPSRQEALGVVERTDVEPDTVVEELQKGFTAEGQVLRTAKVRIARQPAGKDQKFEGGKK